MHDLTYTDLDLERARLDGEIAERERILDLLRTLRNSAKKSGLTGMANINAIIGIIKGGKND